MILGFNHNVMYKGQVFHVQTEDSGVAIPHIITLLYRGGVILSSKKTSYADILKIDDLETVVEELMKEQHKDMLRRLKAGEFDDQAFSTQNAPMQTAPDAAREAAPPRSDVASGDESQTPFPENETQQVAEETGTTPEAPSPPQSEAAPKPGDRKQSSLRDAISLDDVVNAFFAAHEK